MVGKQHRARRLGTLRKIDLRTVWGSESQEFTPWLAEPANIALLSTAVGIDLEAQAHEKRVGLFRADILCKDLSTGGWVLIENQLERSDHGHLGQLLTYAAGLETATIIWVAPSFCDEHKAALVWLNQVTDERISFFGVQVELWEVSGSLPAPRFVVTAGPNDWNRSVKRATKSVEKKQSESALRRREYWEHFLRGLKLKGSDIKLPSPNTLGNLWFRLRGRDLWITVYAASSSGRVGVFLRGKPEYREELWRRRKSIEAELGERPRWGDDGDYWSIAVSLEADPADKGDWPRQHRWLADRLNRFLRVFGPLLPDRG